MTRRQTDALSLYRTAEQYVYAAGYAWELEWQRQRTRQAFSEQDLLRESAWVVLCSGFRESVVRRVFDYISLCFCDFESAAEITRHRRACVDTASSRFGNCRKLHAIASIADAVYSHGFQTLQDRIAANPVIELQKFPYIGPTTSYHLAKNLGFNVAKNDRHLARFADTHGFADAHSLCDYLSQATGEPTSVVDIVLWRFAALAGPSVHRSFSRAH